MTKKEAFWQYQKDMYDLHFSPEFNPDPNIILDPCGLTDEDSKDKTSEYRKVLQGFIEYTRIDCVLNSDDIFVDIENYLNKYKEN